MTAQQQIEFQLRQIALDTAVKAYGQGSTATQVTDRAKAYYKFLKGEENG